MEFVIFDTVIMIGVIIGIVLEKRKLAKQDKKKDGRHTKRSSF